MMSMPGLGLLKGAAARVLRVVMPHDGRDNSAYWRRRATEAGSTAVLTRISASPADAGVSSSRSPGLARCADADVLDIGCDFGEVALWLLAQGDDLRVTGVDFPEMVEPRQHRRRTARIAACA